ncbi:ATP-binding protein [Pseudoduganella violaceinigra]|uniref:ATP-binding protein n=1 Tax=Pseudoduganella violaceinigra TaxID=246602 RepID=UPI000481A9A9|nr:ATP-binding protein [Pseudoduganella violaceinigra]
MLKLWPQSLLARLSLVMVAGLLLTQVAVSVLWTIQLRDKTQADVKSAAQYLGQGAASSIRFFRSLPPSYRSLLIQQFREMGGTRFYVALNRGAVAVQQIEPNTLATSALGALEATLRKDLPGESRIRLDFAWPDQLTVSPDGVRVGDLPEAWVRHILLLKPDPAPILVIQTELEPGNWLYLATLMPNPYFLNSNDPLSADKLVVQGVSLAVLLLLSFLVVRSITRPLAALSDAAETFGKDENAPALPESGSREFVNTARAFSAMRERIAKYIKDRERLFISISHDLRTPITRLKLRAELLDDDALRGEFEEDLDELDMMVKGALQCVKDSDIHENPAEVKLDPLIRRLARSAELAGHSVAYDDSGVAVRGKPLALKRAIGNLLDNALFYGERAQLSVRSLDGWTEIAVRDHGPGVPEEAIPSLLEPYVRLSHGRERNDSGMGLGLGIAKGIVEGHGGQLVLANHPEGGLNAVIRLPA